MSHRQGSLDLPRPFGPYQLLKQVAVGGMAEVYLAKTRGIGGFEKLTALKMIHPRYSEDEHFVQMLVEEAKISVQLNHVNVAQTFDLGCIDGTYFITMEFVEGADAYRVMRRASELGVQIPIETCIFVASEVCAGIDYAHRKRDAEGRPLAIIHRDISPQNILLSFTGEVKVVDFGIAKAALRTQETEAGVIKGKYYYMSPEQAWGDPVDQRTDIFSTGVILYELLTGQMLYLEDNISMLLDRVRKAEIDPPTLRRDEIPQELSQITMKALSKYPEERYATAGAMGQALTRLLYKLAPDYTPSRVAQLMGWLFEPELKRGATSVKLPSSESILPGSTQDAPLRPPAAVQQAASVLFGDAQKAPAKPARPLPPRPKGGRELPPSLEAQVPRARGRDPSAPTAALPVPVGGVARGAPAPVGRATPGRAEADPSESGERRRNADQLTARLLTPSTAQPKLSPHVAERLSQLPGFDSEVSAPEADGDPTEMWENETLVDDDGRFDKFIQDLRGAKSGEGLPIPGPAIDTSPRDHDLDEATSVMSPMEDGITLTGDVRSPFARPEVGAARMISVTDSSERAKPLDAEAATRGHALPKPAASRTLPLPAVPSPPPAARSAPDPSVRHAPAPLVVRGPAPRPVPPQPPPSNTSAWPPPAIAPPPSRAMPPSPVVAWPGAVPAPPSGPMQPLAPGAADPFVVGVQSAVATAAYAAVDAPRPRRYLLLWALVGLLTIGVVALALVLFTSSDEPEPALEVVSVPAGATVSLDRRAVAGTTPLTLRDGLVVGQNHRVEVRLPGYAVWDTSIVASAGLVRQIAILSPLRGKLRIETTPPTAQVFVDGSYRGSTPLLLNDVEATRELAIRITRPGYDPESRTLRLGDQLDQTLRLTLTPTGTGSR